VASLQSYSGNTGVNCSNLSIGQAICYPTSSCTNAHTVANGDTCDTIIANHMSGNSAVFYSENSGINCTGKFIKKKTKKQ
jgi:hypothetical protein